MGKMGTIEFDGIRVLFSTSFKEVASVMTKDGAATKETVQPGEEKTQTEMPEAEEKKEAADSAPSATEEKEGDLKEEKEIPQEETPEEGSKDEMIKDEAPAQDGLTETGEGGMDGMSEMDGMSGMDGMPGMDGMMQEKPSLMQNTGAMIGITAAVLAVGVLAGILLAKLKIKKGVNLYED